MQIFLHKSAKTGMILFYRNNLFDSRHACTSIVPITKKLMPATIEAGTNIYIIYYTLLIKRIAQYRCKGAMRTVDSFYGTQFTVQKSHGYVSGRNGNIDIDRLVRRDGDSGDISVALPRP